ncbi:MAG TPA: molybdopterin converting factor subunit 1 [Dehalococcoidia bacterium]|nr:molybdopterin converting factor subunit 1 [Dehalococcoidia bacterium]
MQITVRLFAAYREMIGQSRIDLDVPEATTAGAVLDILTDRYPGLRAPAEATKFAVNQEYVGPATPLHSGDEVVLLPPVSGGAGAAGRR